QYAPALERHYKSSTGLLRAPVRVQHGESTTGVTTMDEVQRRLELWKAIHGGCWPGPPPDNRLTLAANEVMASLALLNLARTFGDAQFGKQLHGAAAEHLAKS